MLKKPFKAPLSKVRSFVLSKQLLNTDHQLSGKKGAMEIIDTLGYIQIDTISVIERSHHLVLFTRCADYKKEYLNTLQAKDKKIFEYWAHAACFIPMKDYRFYISKMREKPKEKSWSGMWIKKHKKILKRVKDRVKKEGPLSASDFADIKNRKRGQWWDWKPAKAALEILFWRGELMIKERVKFQRVYDLTERVLPENVDSTLPHPDDEKKFFVERALQAMGIATIQDINRYIGISGRLDNWVNKMKDSGQIDEVIITGSKKTYYILAKNIPDLKQSKIAGDPQVLLLSPFDNAIILRNRTAALFNFNYSLECYLPKLKRKYGYFSLPILWQCEFVGRIDLKADRKNNVLVIKNLHLEDKKIGKAFYHALNQRLAKFREFHACKKLKIMQVPRKISKNISL